MISQKQKGSIVLIVIVSVIGLIIASSAVVTLYSVLRKNSDGINISDVVAKCDRRLSNNCHEQEACINSSAQILDQKEYCNYLSSNENVNSCKEGNNYEGLKYRYMISFGHGYTHDIFFSLIEDSFEQELQEYYEELEESYVEDQSEAISDIADIGDSIISALNSMENLSFGLKSSDCDNVAEESKDACLIITRSYEGTLTEEFCLSVENGMLECNYYLAQQEKNPMNCKLSSRPRYNDPKCSDLTYVKPETKKTINSISECKDSLCIEDYLAFNKNVNCNLVSTQELKDACDYISYAKNRRAENVSNLKHANYYAFKNNKANCDGIKDPAENTTCHFTSAVILQDRNYCDRGLQKLKENLDSGILTEDQKRQLNDEVFNCYVLTNSGINNSNACHQTFNELLDYEDEIDIESSRGECVTKIAYLNNDTRQCFTISKNSTDYIENLDKEVEEYNEAILRETDNIICSNDNYSVYNDEYSGIIFTKESELKFESDLAIDPEVAMNNLVGLDCLEEIRVNENFIEGLESLKSLPNLRKVSLYNDQITSINQLMNYLNYENIEHLILRSNNLSSLTDINQFSKIHSLNLHYHSSLDLSPVHDLDLRDFVIDNSQLSSISFIENFDNLRYLQIETQINIDLSMIKNQTLTDLWIDYSTIDNNVIDYSFVNNLLNLEYLRIYSNNPIDLSGIQNSSIKHLHIKNNLINDFNFIKKLNNLESITIRSEGGYDNCLLAKENNLQIEDFDCKK